MVDIQNGHSEDDAERRAHPQLAFHCKANIRGIHHVVKVTDISLTYII